MALLFLSFTAGILTVLAPCLFVFLPVILGGAMADAQDRSRPYVVIASLAVSVVVFTLLLKASTILIDVPEIVWKLLSGVIIGFFGLTLLFPALWDRVAFLLPFTDKSHALVNQNSQAPSFWGNVTLGAALGPIFSSCSPTYFIILGTVLPESFVVGLVYLFAYVLGLSLMLLSIAFLGQKFVGGLKWAVDPRGWFKRSIGIVFLVMGISIIFGLDKKFQTFLLDMGFVDITKIERLMLDTMKGE